MGKAEVECGQEEIEVVFLTEDLFQGRVFVVGHSNETGCSSRDIGKKSTSIIVKKDNCGVVTIRSQNPPGLFVNGYEISCFYMEAAKTVTFPISVEPNTLQPFTEFAEMPRCRYEVVDPTTQEPVSVVSVGNKLLHKWTCDSTATDLWCMVVHSCFVEDGSGTEFQILTDEGCAIDRYLLDNLEYGPGPLQAQKEAHAFKIRHSGWGMPDLSKQKPRLTRSLTSELSAATNENEGFAQIDVRAQEVDVLDPEIGYGLERSFSNNKNGNQELRRIDLLKQRKFTSPTRCVPIEDLAFPASLCAGLLLVMLLVVTCMSIERRQLRQTL
uniref:ZP domain-containing protein n=1 Tax=Meloidogyne javanica TaxID=6303 RepID=A0A915N673_MELJA